MVHDLPLLSKIAIFSLLLGIQVLFLVDTLAQVPLVLRFLQFLHVLPTPDPDLLMPPRTVILTPSPIVPLAFILFAWPILYIGVSVLLISFRNLQQPNALWVLFLGSLNTLIGGLSLVFSIALLLYPRLNALTLTDKGFYLGHKIRRLYQWTEINRFKTRPCRWGEMVAFDLPNDKERTFKIVCGLTPRDLAALLNQWRDYYGTEEKS